MFITEKILYFPISFSYCKKSGPKLCILTFRKALLFPDPVTAGECLLFQWLE